MDRDNIRAIETCGGCPHVFEFMDGDTLIGKLRYRWGHLQLWPELESDRSYRDNIFEYSSHDDLGILPYSKQDAILDDCIDKLVEYWNNHTEEVEDDDPWNW